MGPEALFSDSRFLGRQKISPTNAQHSAVPLQRYSRILGRGRIHSEMILVIGDIQQIVGRERRERVSDHDWSGDA